MPNPANLPILSPTLQDWLAKCESLVEMHKNFVADGGHMQFNFDLLDPEKLPEPLRSEAIAYCERAVE